MDEWIFWAVGVGLSAVLTLILLKEEEKDK
jgi:hypothetical protein